MPDMPSAEQAYEFRHVVTRDAAYQMLLPSERSDLHRHVFEHLHVTLSPADRAHHATEILQHIDAIEDETLLASEFEYLKLAASHAKSSYQGQSAVTLLRRLKQHSMCNVKESLDASHELGATLLALGRVEEAAEVLSDALSHARGESPARVGGIQGALAGVYMESGRVKESADLFEKAIAACKESGDELALGRALTNRAILFRHTGEDVDHEALLNEALEVHRRVGNRSQEGLTLMALGGVHRTAENNELAEELYNRALEIFRELGDRPLAAQAHSNLANVYLTSHRTDQADAAYQQALKAMRELGRKRSEAILLGNYAQLLQGQGRLAACVASARQGVQILQSMNDLMLLPPFRGMLASNLAVLGLFEEAESMLALAETELGADSKVGALDHLLPTLFRFRLAQAFGGYGPGRDPAKREPARLDEAAAVLKRIRAGNTARASKLTSVVDRGIVDMSTRLSKLREALENGKPSGQFNNTSPDKMGLEMRRSILARLHEECPEQLDWMRTNDAKLYAAITDGLEGLAEPDWRNETILD